MTLFVTVCESSSRIIESANWRALISIQYRVSSIKYLESSIDSLASRNEHRVSTLVTLICFSSLFVCNFVFGSYLQFEYCNLKFICCFRDNSCNSCQRRSSIENQASSISINFSHFTLRVFFRVLSRLPHLSRWNNYSTGIEYGVYSFGVFRG